MIFKKEKLKKEQLKLAKKISIKDDFNNIQLIAGIDKSFIKNNKIITSIVIFDIENKKIIEKKHIIKELDIPYLPNYLAYREMPGILECYETLENKPDLLIIGANGILHPRLIGMASHIGLILDIPSIGITNKKLCGEIKENKVYLNDKVIGSTIITKEHANPLFVSPGHKITLRTSIKFVKELTRLPHKLPEPLHLAHRLSKKIKKTYNG